MKIAVVYESRTGTTERAAQQIGAAAEELGHEVGVWSSRRVNPDFLAAADLVFVGTWTDGIFIVGQRPGDARRLKRMPGIWGKKTIGFVTYALDPGGILSKLGELLEGRGADFLGAQAFKRSTLPEGIAEFTARSLAAVEPTTVDA